MIAVSQRLHPATVGHTGLWQHAAAPSRQLRISVVVPVRDEAAGLARTLAALAAQQRWAAPGQRGDFEVLLLANNCRDGSAAIARDFARRQPGFALHVAEVQLPPHLSNVGYVRRVLMDAAAARLQQAGPGAIIASTDGDTVVAPDWLRRTAEAIDSGVDAVGGRIAIAAHDDTDACLRRWRRCDAAYRLAAERLASLLDPDPADPWPRHHQHFCGSLAVTRAAYLQVGRLPEVAYLEDEALVAALRQHDLAVRHSPWVRVTTSGRQLGRAAVGLAWQLRQWAEQGSDGQGLQVEDAPVLAARFRARQTLRAVWAQRRSAGPADWVGIERLAARWQMGAATLAARVLAAPTFGGLWATLEGDNQAANQPALVPVRTATQGLHALIRQHQFS